MCAIAGQFNFDDGPPDRLLLRRMAGRMGLRGPDGEGFFFQGRVGLAHRRLGIVDLKTGRQPMAHPNGKLWIVSNGEIYNYRELRAELASKGHRFRTRSDTEVILHLYEEEGEGCLERLEGMFAFCLFDRARDALFLARDPFGVKPLHYYHDERVFLFSSEIKGLLEHPRLDLALDERSLRQYFNFLCVQEPRCIFKNVRKLPAGHYALIDRGGVALRRYYEPAFASELKTRPEPRAADLREALARSTRLALRSDVPVGVFLSGGVDSAAVACLAARERPRMRSFSVAFKESPYDERAYSRAAAARLGLRHHELEVTNDEAAAVVPAIAAHLDEPFADSSCIPTFLLSRFARRWVKAVLTGDGNDELFAGYPWHAVRGRDGADAQSLLYSPGKTIFSPADSRRLLAGATRGTDGDLGGTDPKLDALTTLERHLYLDLKYTLPSDMLVKVDRMSMMNSLEARVPMLNRGYADYACSLPPGAKLRAGTRKFLFKKAFEDDLPAEILGREKMGFAIPMDVWLWGKGRFRDLVNDTLSDPRTRARGLFDWAFVQRMRREHDTLERLHGHRLWAVFMLEMWLRNFIDKKSPLRIAA